MVKRFLIVAALVFCAFSPALAQTDALSPVTFIAPDLSAWPITTTITKVDVTATGLEIHFDKRDGASRWPDTCQGADCKEPGIDMGALQYSLGLVLKVNGQWFASAPIETWFGNNLTGGPIQDQTELCASGQGHIHCDWFYDASRWGALASAMPHTGDAIGVFVVAGDARNNFFVVRERSNIVTLPLPATGTEASFTFAGGVPVPPPTPVPPPPEPTDLTPILTRLSGLDMSLQQLTDIVNALEARFNQTWGDQVQAFEQRLSALEAKPVPVSCSASVLGIPVHCSLK